jgi:hypothetical protein
MRATTQKVTVGRIVHVYSTKWSGPRPGLVSNVLADRCEKDAHRANVNVFADGCNDAAWLAELRKSASGNTIGGVPIFDGPADGVVLPEELEEHGDRRGLPGSAEEFRILAIWPPRA